MTNVHHGRSSNYFTSLFRAQIEEGRSPADAAVAAAEAFLDGKPAGKGKLPGTDRQSAFWSSNFLMNVPSSTWTTEALVLALARYLGQERYANPALIAHVAFVAPEAIRLSARCSGLVLRHHSPRWDEIRALRLTHTAEFDDFVRIFEIFDRAHCERAAAVASRKQPLVGLTLLELLVYASLYAFERLIPRALDLVEQAAYEVDMQDGWDAINDVMTWKLATCDQESLQLSEIDIGNSLRIHLSPFLFPSREGAAPRDDLYAAFEQLMDAQIELNSFVAQSADAFSYDDGIRFVRQGERLEIIEVDPERRAAWRRDGSKLDRLHGYWLYRGMEALMASEALLAQVSRENLEANLQAFAKAMATQLQLTEVYGLSEHLRTDTGLRVELFRALLAMELMSVFFITAFLQPFADHFSQCGSSRIALGRLAFDGPLQREMQNRWPVTWSDKAAKIARIRSWTTSAEFPQGNDKAAEAILDFWTSDWAALSRRLHANESGLQPQLFERPMLKMGRYLFQLPWMVAVQNNATAAINNLRRIGARRGEAQAETRRIEQRLGEKFAARGFCVIANHHLVVAEDATDPGEIDLICARDDHVLVLEVKSTFLRRSQKDAWIHGSTNLRKAGLQLRRKVHAVKKALASDSALLSRLGISSDGASLKVVGWIVDTSIECDHRRFSGFLKASLEEVLIALRDDRRLLNDPDGLMSPNKQQADQSEGAEGLRWSLYADGFSVERFIDVIERGLVWEEPPPTGL